MRRLAGSVRCVPDCALEAKDLDKDEGVVGPWKLPNKDFVAYFY